jgi:hypothetical protein
MEIGYFYISTNPYEQSEGVHKASPCPRPRASSSLHPASARARLPSLYPAREHAPPPTPPPPGFLTRDSAPVIRVPSPVIHPLPRGILGPSAGALSLAIIFPAPSPSDPRQASSPPQIQTMTGRLQIHIRTHRRPRSPARCERTATARLRSPHPGDIALACSLYATSAARPSARSLTPVTSASSAIASPPTSAPRLPPHHRLPHQFRPMSTNGALPSRL